MAREGRSGPDPGAHQRDAVGPHASGTSGPHDVPSDEDAEAADRQRLMRGPGLAPKEGIDWSFWVSAVFVVVGWIPASWVLERTGVGYFGPLAIPAVLAMVGLLFAAIGVLRSVDMGDLRLRRLCITTGAVAFVRLFVAPWFGYA